MIGIDAEIEKAKAELVKNIPTLTTYGRANLNERDEIGIVPEVLIYGTNEYKDVLIDTSIDGLCFFVQENDIDISNRTYNNVEVSIYFAVNLKKLYPTVQERATEYLHRDILNSLRDGKFEVTSITRGRSSFSDFAAEFVKIGDNMQPYYLCKVSTEIEYNINKC